MKISGKPESKTDLKVLEEVLSTFLSIDKKILELHKCSSGDFLSLNKTMKLNHQKATYITENVSIAFDKIGADGNLKSLQQLKNSFFELQHEVVSFENEINNNLATLEKVQANFSLMFVPINNFRQNLASLKLLLSNIKLTNNLYDRSLKNFSEGESKRIESVLNRVKESCPVFEENIFVIQKHLKTLYSDLTAIKELIFNDLLKKLELLQNDFDIIEKHNQQTLSQKDTIDNLSQNCKSSVGSIITNLQYHDIIRQKMEHIQNTHKMIIKEINETNDPDSVNGKFISNPFLLQIPQIIEIQTAQLLHTNKDYQNAIDHISKKMIEIGQDMTAIARIYKTLSVFEYKGQSVSRERISGIFQKIIADKRKSIEKFKNLADDVGLIQRIVNDLHEKFRDLEMIENSIEQTIIEKISFGNLLVSEEKETASQAQQILKLYADNHFEKNKIKTLFTNTKAQLVDFVRSNSDYIHNRKGMERINQHLNTSEKSFNEIIENMTFLEEIQNGLVKVSAEVEDASKEVVANVKYYEFFEKTIDELVGKFENINSLLTTNGNEMGYSDKVDRKKGLEKIEKYYTMKSERIIHNKALADAGFGDDFSSWLESLEETDNNKDGNDVEFF